MLRAARSSLLLLLVAALLTGLTTAVAQDGGAAGNGDVGLASQLSGSVPQSSGDVAAAAEAAATLDTKGSSASVAEGQAAAALTVEQLQSELVLNEQGAHSMGVCFKHYSTAATALKVLQPYCVS
jgi:hypothetical protein